jgi:hypothetical protein
LAKRQLASLASPSHAFVSRLYAAHSLSENAPMNATSIAQQVHVLGVQAKAASSLMAKASAASLNLLGRVTRGDQPPRNLQTIKTELNGLPCWPNVKSNGLFQVFQFIFALSLMHPFRPSL